MINALNDNIELLDAQVYKNVAIIPITTPKNYKLDILTLKKGFELGLVEVKECPKSTVNTLIVVNNAVTPLLLVDGEEIVGGDQNRIVSSTVLIAAQSEMKIPVNCTEHGRWGYKHEFKQSEYMANSRTRFAKSKARSEMKNVQNAVWDSIDMLEEDMCFSSPTQAMSESYDNVKIDLNESLNEFKIINGQTGVLIIIDGDIKGFEIFFNSEIYAEYHEKILKSYLIDTNISDSVFTINIDEAKTFISTALDSEFKEIQNSGLEKPYEFKNDHGIGTLYKYNEEIIHISYFANNDDEQTEIQKKILNEDVDIIS